MRVLMIDDHALFRAGLAALLERRGIDVVASVGDGQEGLQLARELQPDVILLDMRMPGMDGIEVLRSLRESGNDTPVAVVTTSRDGMDLLKSLRGGAQAYLIKDMEPDELIRALQDVTAGETVVAKELAGVLARVVQGDTPAPGKPDNQLAELTPREREILKHLAEGQSNKVIARNLGISDGTVKLHVKAILRKLGVHSRVEAAVMAVELGLARRSE